MDKEHILKLQKGDIALVITNDTGWFQKINIAFADDNDNPIQMYLYIKQQHIYQ